MIKMGVMYMYDSVEAAKVMILAAIGLYGHVLFVGF